MKKHSAFFVPGIIMVGLVLRTPFAVFYYCRNASNKVCGALTQVVRRLSTVGAEP